MAESFFSRLRRAGMGMHHRIAGPYLGASADEMAWREDARRIGNGTQFLMMALASPTTGTSSFEGYGQRHRGTISGS